MNENQVWCWWSDDCDYKDFPRNDYYMENELILHTYGDPKKFTEYKYRKAENDKRT